MNKEAKKSLTFLKGTFEEMTKPETFEKDGLPPIQRSTVTVITDDGQKAYFEARKKMINLITKVGYNPGDKVNVGFVFMGTEKNGKIYNNLFVNSIKKDV